MTATVAGIHLGIDTHANLPTANTVPDGSLYSCSTHGKLYKSDFSGNTWDDYLTAGSGATSLDGLSDYEVDTSFPGTPATNDQCFRTDLGVLFKYDGTRWVSVNLYRESFSVGAVVFPASANPALAGRMTPWHTDFDLYMEDFYATTYVVTNTGSAFWTVALQKVTVADSPTTIASFTTAAHTQANWTSTSTSIGALLTPGTNPILQVTLTKTSTPGNIYFAGAMSYRLVGP